MSIPRLRIIAINDVYQLGNLPKVASLIQKLRPDAVVLAGDFVSPSPLSSIDGGRGMVATLRAMGLTHACFGNHEADLQLCRLHNRIEALQKPKKKTSSTASLRPPTVINTNMRKGLGDDAKWLQTMTPSHCIVTTPCQQVKVALLGLMSDEPNMFRDKTFRGVPIENVCDAYDEMYQTLVLGSRVEKEQKGADFLLPMTHQSLQRDRELALHMLSTNADNNNYIIIGGHEHEPEDVMVQGEDDGKTGSVRIIKSGTDAERASVIDLQFDVSHDNKDNVIVNLGAVDYDLVDVRPLPDSVVVKKIADSHESVIQKMQDQVIIDCSEHLLPPGIRLSSKRSRFRNTTVGSVFCQLIKDELQVDVALINGATIKGNTEYETNQMSYAQLRQELPFPTKIVTVEMSRLELNDAIHYSRTRSDEGTLIESKDDADAVPRRGYLQVDLDLDIIPHTGDYEEVLQVALPRNLMAGFCNIKPLMALGDRLKAAGKFPGPDDYLQAFDIIVRHSCKNRWFDIVHNTMTFADLDLNHDGVLDGYEVKKMMKEVLGYEPADFMVDDMIASIDTDENGVIDVGEFSYLLATMEREQQWKKF